MSLEPVKTDDGFEIRDGDEVIVVSDSWAPRDPDVLGTLFAEANISTPDKDLRMILYGVGEPRDERTEQS